MALDGFRKTFATAMAEFIGTLMFVLTIQLAILSASPAGPLAIGLALVSIVFTCGPISGGHVNPAVTLAVFLRGKIAARDALMYWVAQIVGGIVGAVVGAIIGGGAVTPALGPNAYLLQAFLAELVFTAALCLVVLGVATSSAAQGNPYFGTAIGFIVFSGVVAVGPISGGSFNPAVTIGLVSVKNLYKLWKNGYALWTLLAQIAGAFVGAFAYYVMAPEEFEHFAENFGDLGTQARNLLPGRTETSPLVT